MILSVAWATKQEKKEEENGEKKKQRGEVRVGRCQAAGSINFQTE